MSYLKEIMDYKQKEPKYLELAFHYADEYSDGLFMRGVKYGFVLGIIFTLLVIIFFN